MAVITITSDYGHKDPDVAQLKGALLREVESPVIIDVSHEISLFDIKEAAFVVSQAYTSFPKGSIHLLCVRSEPSPSSPLIAIEKNGHFFLTADNGIISLIHPHLKVQKVVQIDLKNRLELTASRDIFAAAAAHLSRGGKIDLLGRVLAKFKEHLSIKPTIRSGNNGLIGEVVYIDNFGNAVTNFPQKFILDQASGRSFYVSIRGKRIATFVNEYHEAGESQGMFFGRFNSSGLLEISIVKPESKSKNSASSLLGIRESTVVNIEFE